MSMFKINPSHMDQRKRELIEIMGSAAGADIVMPMQERVIVADLVMSGVEKIFATVDSHMAQSAHVLLEGPALEALLLMVLQEAGHAFEGVLHQRARQHAEHLMADLSSDRRSDIDAMLADLKAQGFEVVSSDDLLAKLKSMGLG